MGIQGERVSAHPPCALVLPCGPHAFIWSVAISGVGRRSVCSLNPWLDWNNANTMFRVLLVVASVRAFYMDLPCRFGSRPWASLGLMYESVHTVILTMVSNNGAASMLRVLLYLAFINLSSLLSSYQDSGIQIISPSSEYTCDPWIVWVKKAVSA